MHSKISESLRAQKPPVKLNFNLVEKVRSYANAFSASLVLPYSMKAKVISSPFFLMSTFSMRPYYSNLVRSSSSLVWRRCCKYVGTQIADVDLLAGFLPVFTATARPAPWRATSGPAHLMIICLANAQGFYRRDCGSHERQDKQH